MRKRSCPWSDGHEPQIKCHVSGKDITNRSSAAMEDVYNKTLTKLFNGAKNATNNNLLEQPKSVLKDPGHKLGYLPQEHNQNDCSGSQPGTTNGMIYNSLAKSSALNTNSTSQVHDIFQINFSGAQKITQPSPVCVSCVRFSSTAAALNPSVVASCQTCTSCSGSTCSACLSHCKGCYSAVCGNCSIDVESVSGNIAEMFIVCLGCRDRYDTDSSGSTMETG